MVLIYKGTNVFLLLAITTAGFAVLHDGSLLLVVVVLVVDKCRWNEKSVVVELWDALHLWHEYF